MSRLREQQLRFAGHIRDPERVPAPEGVEDRRMAVYRELFFNNVFGLVSSAYPVCRELLGEAAWSALVRRFFREHRCRTPLFHEVAGEFLQWLAEHGPESPPWLAELAHYEWLELELAAAEGEALPERDLPPQALAGMRLEMGPLTRLVGYRWPVHRIRADWQPQAEQPVWLLLHRDTTDRIHFTELQPATAWLLQQMQQPGATVAELARVFAREAGLDEEGAVAAACETLAGLCTVGALGVAD